MFVFQLKQLIISDGFKFNSALCVLDFLMRHGQILPDEGLTLTILLLLLGLTTPVTLKEKLYSNFKVLLCLVFL